MMTQCEMILKHLQEEGRITSLTAITEYGILRLASRIADLKRRGVKIKSYSEGHTNRYGQKVYYSVYELIEEK